MSDENFYLVTMPGYGNRANQQHYIHAENFEDAAKKAYYKAFRRRLSAHRVTGVPGKSGKFAAYERLRGGGMSSVGPEVHVMEIRGRTTSHARTR